MNKTININIAGTVFNVDEDAYDLLNKYLQLNLTFRCTEYYKNNGHIR